MARKTPTKSSSAGPTDRATAYARAVVAGEIVAGPHVRNACRRHLDDLITGPERGLEWSIASAEHIWNFFEGVFRLSEGQFEDLPFTLQPSQAFILGSLFGWQKDGARRFRRSYIEQGKGNGKALSLDTDIPTVNGFKPMRDIAVGDTVFDERGAPCNVTAISEVMVGRPCYLVTFSDGAEIVADAQHLWVTSALRTGLPKGPKPAESPRKGMPAIRTTEEIARTLLVPESSSKHPQAKWNHRVDIAGAIKTPKAVLPLPPYTFGVWLGDGNSADSRMTVAYSDWQIVDEICAEGVSAVERSKYSDTTARVLLGSGGRRQSARNVSAQAKLRELGVLGNKHIPDIYLWASQDQRMSVLQGLMDSDGHITKSGQCELTLTSRRLADDAIQLIGSLGFKPTCTESDAVLNGRVIGPRYRIQFWSYSDRPVFRLKRKADRHRERPRTRSLSMGRMVVGCERVESVPVKCISVDSPSRMFLTGRNFIPTHNSPLAGGIGLYGMTADGEAGAEIYAAAAKKEQAGILFRDACKMVRKSPPLLKKLSFSGGQGREFNIANHAAQSFFKPISRDAGKSGSGPRPHFALCDEVHEHPDRGIMEMLERGFKFRRQPLLFMITNSGSNRNSVCWEEHQHAIRAAAGTRTPDDDFTYVGDPGTFEDFDETFSYVCALDKDDDPLEDPSCWIKANPLLGVTVTEKYLAGVVRNAKSLPGSLNGILRLHFCQWTDADTAWMSRATLESVLDDFDPVELSGEEVSVGADLSATQDLAALGFVAQTGTVEVPGPDGKMVRKPTFDAWVEAWTPGDTLAERATRDQTPYDVWVREGWLNAPPGKVVRMDFMAARVAEAQSQYRLKVLAYDAYAFRKNFEPALDENGVTVPLVEHPQGGKRRAQPTEDQKQAAESEGKEAEGLWMPGSLAELETLMLEGRIRIRRSPVAISAIMGAMIESDAFGNRWFSKRKATTRIDPLVALAMAVGAATATASTGRRNTGEIDVW